MAKQLQLRNLVYLHGRKIGRSSGLQSWHFDYCSKNPNKLNRRTK